MCDGCKVIEHFLFDSPGLGLIPGVTECEEEGVCVYHLLEESEA